MSDEEDVVWGEQAQLAVEREMNPPKGPGGNPKVDRRSTTGSNFMRCLPDQATSFTELTSDRTPFLGGSTAVARQRCQRRRRGKFGVQLCRAEREQRGVWDQEGALKAPGGSRVGVMPMSHADGSGGSQVGSQVGSQAHAADGETTHDTHKQSEDCSSSSSGQTGSFFSSRRRHSGEMAASHCPPIMNKRIQTGADSRLSHASQRSIPNGNACGVCSISYSHHSSCGGSCEGSCFMHRQARHACLGSMQHGKEHAKVVQRQAQPHARLRNAPVSCVSRSASVPGRLAQSRLHLKGALRSVQLHAASKGTCKAVRCPVRSKGKWHRGCGCRTVFQANFCCSGWL